MRFYICITQKLSVTLLLMLLGSSIAFASNPIEIKIGVLPGLQFDKVRFHVKPGQQVKILFNNTDDMDHNLLIVSRGSREKVVKAAAEMGGEGITKSYIPSIPEVLWSIPVVHGEQSKELLFTAPKEEGVYPYVCTLPGHGYVMYGAMYVSNKEVMPLVEEDIHIPEVRRKSADHIRKDHPYQLIPPYYYRTYVEGASPAAIIVRLSDHLSYCWDAGVCRFRFAWKGGFVDNTEIWKGHRDAKSEILGNIFYREEKKSPIHIGEENNDSKIQFKGYKIIEGGYLEFHYSIGGVDVYETIKELGEEKGLTRNFRVPNLKDKLYFHFTKTKGVSYYYKNKTIQGDFLELNPHEGTEFSVELKLSN